MKSNIDVKNVCVEIVGDYQGWGSGLKGYVMWHIGDRKYHYWFLEGHGTPGACEEIIYENPIKCENVRKWKNRQIPFKSAEGEAMLWIVAHRVNEGDLLSKALIEFKFNMELAECAYSEAQKKREFVQAFIANAPAIMNALRCYRALLQMSTTEAGEAFNKILDDLQDAGVYQHPHNLFENLGLGMEASVRPAHPEEVEGQQDGEQAMLVRDAALDLLAALKAMVKDYRSEGCPNPNCLVCQRSNHARLLADQAIAKAGG